MTSDAAAKKISIWEALDGWGKSLPGWQQFTVSYAVRDGTLSEERIGEAYAIYLRGAQLTTDITPLAAIPDSITGRADGTDSSPMLIAGIKNPVNVNAIPGTAELHFGNGLTVIYGHNGAGKSGFARIMAAACFSRSRERILPNVYDASASTLPASADILIRRGQAQDETLPVTQGTEHAVLRRISVFDSAIARVHLAEETPLGFQPAGFDVFDEVTRVIEAISRRLDADIAKRRSENKFVNIFIGESAIRTEIGKLSKDTDAIDISTHWVDRGADGAPGNVILDDCPANSDAYKTPHRAKEFLAKAKKGIGQTRVDAVRAGASALRQTVEEIIIRDLFKGTVKRWDEQVKIGNLKEIEWSNDVADEICLLQDDISRLIDAHSTSDEFGGGMPEPDELEKLIGRVDAMQANAKKRRK